jgi:ribosomal protein L11 methyltransferase
MSYLQLTFHTTTPHVPLITQLLNLLEAKAVTWQDDADEPVLEPALNTTPLWSQTKITGLFDANCDLEKIANFICAQVGDAAITQYEITSVPDENWERSWMKDFHPMQFGKNLWICPSTMTPPDPDAVTIILDPGLAFGTGTHPTTALCLEWLDANPPKNKTVIDYGCGSGILALAALKLGAKEVWAIDHDEQALQATRENALRNRLDLDQLHIAFPSGIPSENSLKADCLLANILANPLIELAAYFSTLLKASGKIVLSGILENQTEEICKFYQKYFDLEKPVVLNGWVRVEGKLKLSE